MERDNHRMMIGPAFGEIQKLRNYSPAVNDVLVGADLTSIKMLNDLRKILGAKDSRELSHILHYEICPATEKEIGFVRGYIPTLSIAKLTAFLEKVSTAYINQYNLDQKTLKNICKQQEQMILKQEAAKRELQDKIDSILEFAKIMAFNAKDKARLTARESKHRFDVVRETIGTILENRRRDRNNPEEVDVEKLQRVYWGQPERYYK